MVAVSRAPLAAVIVLAAALGSVWFVNMYSPSSSDTESIQVVFHIFDQGNRTELSGVNVEVGGYTRTSGNDGDVEFVLRPGTYPAVFTKSGYVNVTKSFDLSQYQRIPVAMAKNPPSTGHYTLAFLTSDGQSSKPEFRVKADGVFYSQHQTGSYDRCTLTLEAVAPAGWKFRGWGYVAGYYVDTNENPLVIEVDRDGIFEALFEPTRSVPTIYMSPADLSTADLYTVTGSGFTPYGEVHIIIADSGRDKCGQETVYADGSGRIAGTFTMRCGDAGTLRAVDDMTGSTSNDLNFTITISLS